MTDKGAERDSDLIPDNIKFNDRFCRLRKINKYTDCSFKAENRIINCHKLILAASSPVFEAMFYGQFSHDITNSILISDVKYDTFELFVEYIYTGELKLKENDEVESLVEMSHCAQKYLIDDLRKKCIARLADLLNRNSIFKFLGRSFELHLEDFLVSCLYFFVELFEARTGFCNAILNSTDISHLSSHCFEFVVKNLLDYFGEREDILCMIKSWSIMKCHLDNVPADPESMAVNVEELSLEKSLNAKIHQQKAAFFETSPSSRVTKSFHRNYYKPVRPLIIEKNQLSFDFNISFKRFVIINSLMINSRLIPEQFDICDMNNQTYTENFDVEIFDKFTNESIYKEHHSVDNVGFNTCFQIKFNDRMILFPYRVYTMKISWSDEALGFEYPAAIFSLKEKGSDVKVDMNGNPLSVAQFHEYKNCYNTPFGSIVQGIYYDLIS